MVEGKNQYDTEKASRCSFEVCQRKSPFYKELYADMGDDYSTTDIPAVSKSELMARFDDVLTDQNITMERIDAFTQDLDNIGRMIDGKYLIFKTSGSTGNPDGGYISWGIDSPTDTSLFLTTYRGGSHLPADIYS